MRPWWQGKQGEWYVAVQFLIFALVFFGPRNVGPGSGWPAPWGPASMALGAALGLVGGGLSLWGVLSLGRNLTAVPAPKDDAELVETGAYQLVRHPIYSGIILGAFGWALLVNGELTLLYAFILLLFFDIKSRREERWLQAKYDGYSAYQTRVRKLIPFLY